LLREFWKSKIREIGRWNLGFPEEKNANINRPRKPWNKTTLSYVDLSITDFDMFVNGPPKKQCWRPSSAFGRY
jgi:hypothetical protein